MKTDIDEVNQILEKTNLPPCKLCGKNAIVRRPTFDGMGVEETCLECQRLADAGKFFRLFGRCVAQTGRLFVAMMRNINARIAKRREFQGFRGIEWGEPTQWSKRRHFELNSERRRKRDALTFWRCYGVAMTFVALVFLWLACR